MSVDFNVPLIFDIFIDARSGLQLLSALVYPCCSASVGIGSLMSGSWTFEGHVLMYTAVHPRIIALLMKTKLRPRLIYAPCILIGAVVSFLAGFVVGHVATFAAWTLTWQRFFIFFEFYSQQIHHQHGLSQQELMNLVTFYLHPSCSTSQLAGLLS